MFTLGLNIGERGVNVFFITAKINIIRGFLTNFHFVNYFDRELLLKLINSYYLLKNPLLAHIFISHSARVSMAKLVKLQHYAN